MNNRTGSDPSARVRARALAPGGGSSALRSATALGVALWAVVGIGLLYGVWESAVKVATLFN
jgi:hypothetical protein